MDKPILDATCGGRMMWFDKQHPAVDYVDSRKLTVTLCDGRVFKIAPDIEVDFTDMPFPDRAYKLVVFDPPHLLNIGDDAWMSIKYGKLDKDWRNVIHDGFWECMRVLDDYGTLVFKWSEVQIPTRDVIKAIGMEPLFGHKSGKVARTHWMVFMRFPADKEG